MPRQSREVEELGLKTAKGTAIFATAQVLSSAITLLLVIGMERLLMIAQFGLYGIAVAFAAFLGMGGNFGIGTALRKMLPENLRSKNSSNGLINNGYILSEIVALAIAIPGLVLSRFIAVHVYDNPALTLPLAIASIVILLSVVLNTTLAALVGLDRIKEASIADILYSAAQLVLSVALVLAGYGINGAMAGYALGFLAGIGAGLFYLFRLGYSFAGPIKKTLRRLTSFSVPIAISNVSTQGMTNFAVLVLGVYVSSTVVGNYTAAFRIGSVFTILLASVIFILIAAFSRALAHKRMSRQIGSIYNGALRYSLMFILPLLAYSLAVSSPLMRLLFGGQAALAPFYFSVISTGIVLGIVGMFAGTLIISYGDTKKFMYYQLLVIAIEFVLLLALTPVFKVSGTLFAAFVATPIISDIIFILALERQFSVRMQLGQLGRVVAPSVVLWVLGSILAISMGQRLLSLVAVAVLFVILYPLLMLAAGALRKDDRAFLRGFASRLGAAGTAISYILGYAELFAK